MSERVGKWVLAQAASTPDFEAELVDLADFELPLFNEPVSPRYNPHRQPEPVVASWLSRLAAADGYIIVTPEYNHSVPGVLKNALDFVASELAKKPVAIVTYGYSAAGARAAEHLKGILNELKAAVVPEAVAIQGLPDELLTADGAPISPGPNRLTTSLRITLTELAWWAKTLSAGRALVAEAPAS
jgi:NAD(P)H-dependent FMN reductase